jgi:hypothetical protein
MKKLVKAFHELMQRLYAEAEPSMNWEDFYNRVENGEPPEDKWFQKHCLNLDRQTEIINEVEKKYKLNKWERKALQWEWLSYSPTSVIRDLEE